MVPRKAPKSSPKSSAPPPAKNQAYEAHRERERARQAQQSRSGRDVGPLPAVADPRRRKATAASLRKFCEAYFPERFQLAWSDDHLRVIARLETTIRDGGCQAFAMPRGSGKTTLCEVAVLWATMTGRRKFAALIGASRAHADEMLDSLRGELETNQLLAADWPEVCHPIAELEGIHNRARGQLCDGVPTRIRWAGAVLVLPSIVKSKASGAVICVRGITGRVRGMKFRRPDGETVRPDVAIIDDPQTDASARSERQCAKRLAIIQGAILGLAGPGKTIAACCPCTVIQREDVADQLLDTSLHPEWHGERTKLVYAWPESKEALKRWEEYADARRSDMMAGGDGSAATAIYRKHRKVMDAGSRVGWAERKLPGELSALQHAFNLRIDSPDTFDAEYQNDPPDESEANAQPLDAPAIAAKVSSYKRGEIPLKVSRLTWFVDVHKQLLYWAVCGWEPGFTGHVLDYGTWPKQPTHYFALRDARNTIERSKLITAQSLEGRILQALGALFSELHARTWKREDGAELHLDLGLVDANWGESTDAVYAACRQAGKSPGLRVMPSHGTPFGPAKKPISRWDRRHAKGRIGEEWHIPPLSRGRVIQHVLIDAGRRKSFLQRRLATPLGDPGSLTFFKEQPYTHRLIAEHLTAETGTRVSGPYGEMIAWTVTPNRDNHWLDCLAGCATAESICGGQLNAGNLVLTQTGPPAARKRRTVKF